MDTTIALTTQYVWTLL